MDQEKIGKFIFNCRKELNITQQELAEKLGVTDKAISKWENGRCLMDISLLKPLSEILNVTIVEIINGERIKEEDMYKKSNEITENTLYYADKKIKNNKLKTILSIILIIVLVVITSVITYKGLLLSKYKAEPLENYKERMRELSFKDTLKVYKKSFNLQDYMDISDNIRIKNNYSNYIRYDDKTPGVEYTTLTLYGENDKIESQLRIGLMDQYINMFVSDDIAIYGTNDTGQFNSADRKYFLLKNDINDDIDFIEFVSNNYYIKSNFFTSSREIKENYALNLFVGITLPKVESTTKIEGDYEGYIFNINNKIREIHIIRNDISYGFTLIGEKLNTDNYIIEFISSLELK